jgi:hypothetical protein
MANETETPTDFEFRQRAMAYVDSQLAVMTKYGSAPILSYGEYSALVNECEQIARKIWAAHHPEVT